MVLSWMKTTSIPTRKSYSSKIMLVVHHQGEPRTSYLECSPEKLPGKKALIDGPEWKHHVDLDRSDEQLDDHPSSLPVMQSIEPTEEKAIGSLSRVTKSQSPRRSLRDIDQSLQRGSCWNAKDDAAASFSPSLGLGTGLSELMTAAST